MAANPYMRPIAVIGEGLVEFRREGDHYIAAPGGDAANLAIMASRMGVSTALISRVGNDELGRQLLKWWRDEGVECDNVVIDQGGPTGIYVNSLDATGMHHLDYHRTGSAGSRLCTDDLVETDHRLTAGIVVVSGISLAISSSAAAAANRAFSLAVEGGIRALVVNHRPRLGGSIEQLKTVAADADIVFVSSEEAKTVFGVESLPELSALLPNVTELVLTSGASGATLQHEEVVTHFNPPPVVAVDTAGAGDALAGAYLALRALAFRPVDALWAGVCASALSVTGRGCSFSYPTRQAVRAQMEFHPKETP
jgi:2-dehydro-3-deoxygluconokinase